MTRSPTHHRIAAAAAAAVLAGCAAPTATGPASPGSPPHSSFSSVAPSTPSPLEPARIPAPALARSPSAEPRLSLDSDAAASTAPYPHGRRGVPAGGLPPLSTRTSRDPDVVARAALRVLFGSDTTLDTQPMDAEKRALPWLGGPFAAAVAAAQVIAAPGAVWNSWAAHRAHLVVTVTRGYTDGAPPDTPTAAYRQWTVTQTPVGVGPSARRWTGLPVSTVVYTITTRTGGRWAVTTFKEAL